MRYGTLSKSANFPFKPQVLDRLRELVKKIANQAPACRQTGFFGRINQLWRRTLF